jgi:hypothetical protein
LQYISRTRKEKEDEKEEKQSDGGGEAHGLGTCTSKLVLKGLHLPPLCTLEVRANVAHLFITTCVWVILAIAN